MGKEYRRNVNIVAQEKAVSALSYFQDFEDNFDTEAKQINNNGAITTVTDPVLFGSKSFKIEHGDTDGNQSSVRLPTVAGIGRFQILKLAFKIPTAGSANYLILAEGMSTQGEAKAGIEIDTDNGKTNLIDSTAGSVKELDTQTPTGIESWRSLFIATDMKKGEVISVIIQGEEFISDPVSVSSSNADMTTFTDIYLEAHNQGVTSKNAIFIDNIRLFYSDYEELTKQ